MPAGQPVAPPSFIAHASHSISQVRTLRKLDSTQRDPAGHPAPQSPWSCGRIVPAFPGCPSPPPRAPVASAIATPTLPSHAAEDRIRSAGWAGTDSDYWRVRGRFARSVRTRSATRRVRREKGGEKANPASGPPRRLGRKGRDGGGFCFMAAGATVSPGAANAIVVTWRDGEPALSESAAPCTGENRPCAPTLRLARGVGRRRPSPPGRRNSSRPTPVLCALAERLP